MVEYADQGDWAVRRRGPQDNGHEGLGLGGRSRRTWARRSSSSTRWSRTTTARIGRQARPRKGRPDRRNSVADNDIAPLISDVIHSPAVPRSNEPVTVTADLNDELESGITATLFWRVSSNTPPPFSPAAMFDDGLHGDGLAGDGEFGADLPQQPDGTVIEFYVRATDAANNSRTWPAPTTPAGQQGANATYQVDDSFAPFAPGESPIYRIVMTVAEDNEFSNINRNTNAQINTTLIFQTGSGRRCAVFGGRPAARRIEPTAQPGYDADRNPARRSVERRGAIQPQFAGRPTARCLGNCAVRHGQLCPPRTPSASACGATAARMVTRIISDSATTPRLK